MRTLIRLALLALPFLAPAPASADSIVVLAPSAAQGSLPSFIAFAEWELRGAFDVELCIVRANEAGRLLDVWGPNRPGEEWQVRELEPGVFEEASLLVVLPDGLLLDGAGREHLSRYVASGKPVVVLQAGLCELEGLDEFQSGVLGANRLGRWEEHGPPELSVVPGAERHLILAELDLNGLKSHSPLERVLPLAPTATALITGRVADVREPEPVVWTNGYKGASILVSTLGDKADFAQPTFRALLRRSIFWALGRTDLSGSEDAPVLDETNSVSLFDGESLQGWTTHGGRYDGNAKWNVEDGVIVGRQGPNKAGGLIYTDRPHKNFIVSFETWIDWPFDSGVFLRMVPREVGGKGMQVTLDYRPGGEIGGLYADGFVKHNEDSTELLKPDAWNEVVVRCKGDDMHVTAWLNGELLIDYETPAGTEGFAETGLIGLQVHGGENVPGTQRAMFRNVRLRELPDYDRELYTCDDRGILSLTEIGAKAGWTSMFNGRDLAGWDPRPAPESYRVEDGVLVFPVAGVGGELRSLKEYRDFELRLDFKIAKMANSGLFLRAAPEGNPAYSGCEVQILDDFNWESVTKSTLQPYQKTGGLYGAVPPGVPEALRPLGEWNTYQVRYVGSRLAVRLNGHLLYDVDTFEIKATPPFRERAERGFIGLQRHGTPDAEEQDFAWFRNIYVREIAEEKED